MEVSKLHTTSFTFLSVGFDMFTRWYCNVPITSILLITISIALACTSPKVYPSNGLPVVLDGEVFLGRKAEVGTISEWIQNSTN